MCGQFEDGRICGHSEDRRICGQFENMHAGRASVRIEDSSRDWDELQPDTVRAHVMDGGPNRDTRAHAHCRTEEQMEQIIKYSKGIHFFKYITNVQASTRRAQSRRRHADSRLGSAVAQGDILLVFCRADARPFSIS